MSELSAIFVALLVQFSLLFPIQTFNKPIEPPPPLAPKIVQAAAPTSEPKIDTNFELISSPSSTPSPTLQPKADHPLAGTIKVIKSTPIPTKVPPPPPTSAGSSVRDYIMQEINNYRRSQGLSEVRTDSYTCNFAAIRAQEIASGFNHDGFTNRLNNRTLPYPSYKSVTENLAKTSNYKDVVNLWINSSGHAANMRKDTSNVCVRQNGSYFAYEGWKP